VDGCGRARGLALADPHRVRVLPSRSIDLSTTSKPTERTSKRRSPPKPASPSAQAPRRRAAAFEPTDAVRGEWLRRVEAEYRSAAITQHLTLWLIQMGAPPDLVRAGLRITGDELDHAELSHGVFLAAGGKGGPRLERESLALEHNQDAPLEHDVVRTAVEVFCLGETLAVPLFKELREECSVPVAREALDRILRDEVRHRDFGWMLLESLMDHELGPLLRELVVRELPSYFARLRRAYAPSHGAGRVDMTDAERAWGLMPVALYRSSLEKALERDWVPRFARFDIDARAAFARAMDRS